MVRLKKFLKNAWKPLLIIVIIFPFYTFAYTVITGGVIISKGETGTITINGRSYSLRNTDSLLGDLFVPTNSQGEIDSFLTSSVGSGLTGGSCVPTHACDQVYCGDNGCGTTCGCGGGYTCSANTCVVTCIPRSCTAAAGDYCGDDGCGGVCGCADLDTCVEGVCTAPGTTYKSCSEILKAQGKAEDGVYTINPDKKGDMLVYCDMTTNGGGWTLLFNLDTADNDIRTWSDTDFWTTNIAYGDLKDAKYPWKGDFKSEAYSRLKLGNDLMVLVHEGGPKNFIFGKSLYGVKEENIGAKTLLDAMTVGDNYGLTTESKEVLEYSSEMDKAQGWGDPFIRERRDIVLNDVRYGSGHGTGDSHNFVRFSTSAGSADSHETYGLGGDHDINCSCGHWGFGYEASVDTWYCSVFRTGSNSHAQYYGGYTWCPAETMEIDYAVFTR
jgi:hypothetical protein